jgi:exodeoxyribonuclease VII large subunit
MLENKILTVSEITRQIKGVLELGFNDIWLKGEISNFKNHSSGHLYFTLKDEGAQISAVMWKGRASSLLFRPTDGMKVIVRGRITVYEPRGNYQIDCLNIQPFGVGDLQLAFERLKQKLMEEGLFTEEYKIPIPEFPQRIGIVTSPTGAAIHDIISILSRRQPSVEVILVPVKVQGIGAAEEIAEAIETLNQKKMVDVMIIGRGGGSLEDLWAFNEEVVARAIFASEIPIISAVGHEIDFSISDFVSDLRAPTPSAAAELVVRDKEELIDIIGNYCYTLNKSIVNKVESNKKIIKNLVHSYYFNKPIDLVRQKSQQLDELNRLLHDTISHSISIFSLKTESLKFRIESLSPKLVLKRGYAIVRQKNKIISKLKDLSINSNATIEFTDGSAESKINSKLK